MGREGSVAPKERVNITYKPATGGAQEERELPLKILSMGDFTGREDERPVEERKPIAVDKDNFNEVMAAHELALDVNVDDKLSGEEDAQMALSLKFNTLKDFGPEQLAEQVPEIRQMLQLRDALTALKGPLSNVPAFRKKLQSLLGDEEGRKKLMDELGISSDGGE